MKARSRPFGRGMSDTKRAGADERPDSLYTRLVRSEDAHGRRPGAGGLRPCRAGRYTLSFTFVFFKGTLEECYNFGCDAAPIERALRISDGIVGLSICKQKTSVKNAEVRTDFFQKISQGRGIFLSPSAKKEMLLRFLVISKTFILPSDRTYNGGAL